MANELRLDQASVLPGKIPTTEGRVRLSIATKLVLSFLLLIVVTSAIFTGVVIWLIRDHIQSDAQGQVRDDLDSAREIYLNSLNHINSVIVGTTKRSNISEAILADNIEQILGDLSGIKIQERLDFLTITDEDGNVLVRTGNSEAFGDNVSTEELIRAVRENKMPAASTSIVKTVELTGKDRIFGETPDSMILGAAAPIFDSNYALAAIVYGGKVLNDDTYFICEMGQTIFRSRKYEGHDIGFITIYQGDLGILTCPRNLEGSASIGSRVPADIYRQVVGEGKTSIDRELVMDNWYITVYEPIRNASYDIVGALQVGQLEERYADISDQIINAFVTITLGIAVVSILFAYFISRRISVPLRKLVFASREVAQGDLDTRVDIKSNDEVGELAGAFNSMAATLQERDEKLKELTRHRIRRSERLAIVGKLSANVAHELNNPLQGVVTYAHLLLERLPAGHQDVDYLNIIVTQADRCREIIRGLLDFARQREPDKTLCNVNDILLKCISLLEKQALFLNVRVLKDFEVNLPLTVIDPSQIERVFVNLLVNAAEAMDGRGYLTLITRVDATGEWVEVIIADTGYGIPEEHLRYIFDPFYTTKEVGQGTGLGLAISYGIITEHGATISVESEVGKGTSFSVKFPIAGVSGA